MGKAKEGNYGAPAEELSMDDELYIKIGDRIRTLRQNKDMSQNELADHCGYSRVSVVNIEAGRQRAPVHMYGELAWALGSSLVDLMGDAEIPAPVIPERMYCRVTTNRMVRFVPASVGKPSSYMPCDILECEKLRVFLRVTDGKLMGFDGEKWWKEEAQ